MKTVICITAFWLAFYCAWTSPASGQGGEGYTFITSERGPQVCIGRWIPSTDVALPGVCDGQVFGLPQLAAISAKQSVDRLDQLLFALNSIDQKLAVSNDQITQLIKAAVNTQTSIDRQVRQGGELLREVISRRFDELPKEILENDLFKEELARLKEDILGEVERQYSTRQPAPSGR